MPMEKEAVIERDTQRIVKCRLNNLDVVGRDDPGKPPHVVVRIRSEGLSYGYPSVQEAVLDTLQHARDAIVAEIQRLRSLRGRS